jgi:hypothetical protein
MPYYIQFLSLAYSFTRKGISMRDGTAILATIPLFLVVFSTLFGLVVISDLPVSYLLLVVTALGIIIGLCEVNSRLLKRYWEVVIKLSKRQRLAGVTYLAILLSACFYFGLIVLLVKAYLASTR